MRIGLVYNRIRQSPPVLALLATVLAAGLSAWLVFASRSGSDGENEQTEQVGSAIEILDLRRYRILSREVMYRDPYGMFHTFGQAGYAANQPDLPLPLPGNEYRPAGFKEVRQTTVLSRRQWTAPGALPPEPEAVRLSDDLMTSAEEIPANRAEIRDEFGVLHPELADNLPAAPRATRPAELQRIGDTFAVLSSSGDERADAILASRLESETNHSPARRFFVIWRQTPVVKEVK